MTITKLSPIDKAVYDLAEAGVLDDQRAKVYPGSVANLQNMGMIVRNPRTGLYVPRSQMLNEDGSSQLTPARTEPPKKRDRENLPNLGVRLPPKWVRALREESADAGLELSAFVRDLLGPIIEGDAYKPGKYDRHPRNRVSTPAPSSDQSGEFLLGRRRSYAPAAPSAPPARRSTRRQ